MTKLPETNTCAHQKWKQRFSFAKKSSQCPIYSYLLVSLPFVYGMPDACHIHAIPEIRVPSCICFL
ncbi:Uncharacterized protein APZ42_014088 [Daphnia magna]|uniref:Uncharacterized protein n=1 Tax=Daphnia magna TaxID=35525 RepID=A0A162Q965_9CRUS|nr:Uncharacterized protein APZ42_014088 [Daphnia magna]